MATTIVTKYGGDAPAASDIVRGELAVDTENGRLYTENAAGAVVEIGLNPAGNISKTSGDLTLDVAGNIRLDADDNGEIRYLDGGTQYAAIKKDGNNALFQSIVADGDFIIQGIDGASFVSALTLDMSASGAATFNSSVTSTSFVSTAGGTFTTASGNDLNIVYPAGRSLFIKEGSETHVTVDNVGNVGIGASSPSSTFRASINGDGSSVIGGIEFRNAAAGGSTFTIGHASATSPSATLNVVDAANLIFKTSNTERLRITSAGALQLSDVNSPNDINTAIYSNSDVLEFEAFGTNGAIAFSTGSGVDERLRIDASGNLLVGKSSSGISNSGFEVGQSGQINVTQAGAVVGRFNRKTSEGSILELQKDGTTIGTIGVTGTNDIEIHSTTANHTGLRLGEGYYIPTDNTGATADNAVDLGLPSGRYKDFYLSGKIAKGTGGELDLRSDGGGFAYKQNLDVATAGCTFTGASTRGDVAAIRLWQTATGANGGYIRFDTCNSGSTTPTEKARLDSNGHFLIGTTSTSATSGIGTKIIDNATAPYISTVGSASTNGTYGYYLYSTDASAFRCYIGYGGTIFATSTSITAISDESLKENIRDLDKGLDTIKALKPRRFDWKNGDGKDIMGFVAQEVEEVLPELVHDYQYNKTETKLGLKMGDMLPTLVKAIQEQQATIESLTARIAALES